MTISVTIPISPSESIAEIAASGVEATGVGSAGVTRVEVGAGPEGAKEGDHAGIASTAHNGHGEKIFPGSMTADTLVRIQGMDVRVGDAMQAGLLPPSFLKDQGVAPQAPQQAPQQQADREKAIAQAKADAEVRLPGDLEGRYSNLMLALDEPTRDTVINDMIGQITGAKQGTGMDDIAESLRAAGVSGATGENVEEELSALAVGFAGQVHSIVAGALETTTNDHDTLEDFYDIVRQQAPERLREAIYHQIYARDLSKWRSLVQHVVRTIRIDEVGRARIDK